MLLRIACLALVFLFTIAGTSWGQCPENPGPPDVVQLQGESGGQKLAVRGVHLEGGTHATVEQQNQIAASLAGFCFPENRQDLIAERIRAEFQRFGFFKARTLAVIIEAQDSSADPPTVSILAQVEDGERYRLKEITFAGNQQLSNSALRKLFPMKAGDAFDTDRVRHGLEDLRSTYAAIGYINATPVPSTTIDEEKKAIGLSIDVDEGLQYFVSSLVVRNADPDTQAALRSLWTEMLPPGSFCNGTKARMFFAQAKQLLPSGAVQDRNLVLLCRSHGGSTDFELRAGESVTEGRMPMQSEYTGADRERRLDAATNRLNAGEQIPFVQAAWIEHFWQATNGIPREQRQHVAVGLEALAGGDPDAPQVSPEQQIALMARYMLLDALIEIGVLDDHLKDESQRRKVFAAAASFECNKNDLGEAMALKRLHESSPADAERYKDELRQAGYDPAHPQIGNRFLEWVRQSQ